MSLPNPRLKAPELSEQADLDLTRRAIDGVWASVVIFLVLAIFSSYFKEHPPVAFPSPRRWDW